MSPKETTRSLGEILLSLFKQKQFDVLNGSLIEKIEVIPDGFEITLLGEKQKTYFRVQG